MSEGLSYEEGKKRVVYGLYLLGAVTIVEVFFSLLGKGHVVAGFKEITWPPFLIRFLLVALSL